MDDEITRIAEKETLIKEIKDLKNLDPFFTPDQQCPLCNSKAALWIHKVYIESRNIDVRRFCAMYAFEFERKTNKKLTEKIVKIHFNEHFNAKAYALETFNQMKMRENMTDMVPVQDTELIVSDEIKRVYDLLTDTYVNDLKILDFSVKEQIHHLKELREIKADRKEKGIGIIDLIMKEEDILANIQYSLINKIKVFQTGRLQQAQTKVLNTMGFLNESTMHLLGIDEVALSPIIIKKTQDLFVTTVISHFLKRVTTCINMTNLPSEQKALFYSKLKKEMEGIEQEIYDEFEKNIKDVNIINAEVVSENIVYPKGGASKI